MGINRVLTTEELQDLTGFKRFSKQRQALGEMGINHRIRPDGKPVVTSADLNGDAYTAAETTPNFEALK